MIRGGRAALLAGIAAAAIGCSPPASASDIRGVTDHYRIRVTTAPQPPFARNPVQYTVVVRDKDSGQPIQGGQGRIFASDSAHAKEWDVLVPAAELGTYHSHLSFITSGTWAMAVQFRRDSTMALERIDWIQEVRPDTSSIP